MDMVNTTPAMRHFAITLAHWIGYVDQCVPETAPYSRSIRNIQRELVHCSQAVGNDLENKWPLLSVDIRKVQTPTIGTKAATAAASAMQALYEGNKSTAAHLAAQAWTLAAKVLPAKGSKLIQSIGLECAIFLTLTSDLEEAVKILSRPIP